MSTNSLSARDIKRSYQKFDARGKVLGRLATEIATTLMGKNKPSFVPYLDNGDYVVVVNASGIKVTGKKMTQKTYFRHSGYPGGDKTESLQKLLERRPTEVVRHAVAGMLPKTKLGRVMMKKLFIYEGVDHPYKAQLKGDENGGN